MICEQISFIRFTPLIGIENNEKITSSMSHQL
jgi:hypothetical protein